ncbi:hypothetical protein [Chitinophaga sp. S165]|uniref:hypothetical protein n=1 Tax=Chitinophaga sp. S165 TaxID=2135462 RepID=UPI000D713AB0|nr:hypothetical protein [Chitinophaga sp. S165]PWV56549.1 hypothetical protein C7475_1011066 [Chitinophaga sp. S165]
MTRQELIELIKQNMDAEGIYHVPAIVSEHDPNPELIMPKGLNWEQKKKWALDTFDSELKRIRKKYKQS